jgi:hypothetical protein
MKAKVAGLTARSLRRGSNLEGIPRMCLKNKGAALRKAKTGAEVGRRLSGVGRLCQVSSPEGSGRLGSELREADLSSARMTSAEKPARSRVR